MMKKGCAGKIVNIIWLALVLLFLMFVLAGSML
jgi:hypothetical protein